MKHEMPKTFWNCMFVVIRGEMEAKSKDGIRASALA
jgi:hypothetical protein